VDTIVRVRRAFHVQGWSVKKIVRELHVSRNTVRNTMPKKQPRQALKSFSDRAVKGQISDADAEKQSRDFQEAIFHRRSSSPLLLRGVYWIHRSALEEQMNVAAEAMVAEYAAIKA
jgi:hypothetical protein